MLTNECIPNLYTLCKITKTKDCTALFFNHALVWIVWTKEEEQLVQNIWTPLMHFVCSFVRGMWLSDSLWSCSIHTLKQTALDAVCHVLCILHQLGGRGRTVNFDKEFSFSKMCKFHIIVIQSVTVWKNEKYFYWSLNKQATVGSLKCQKIRLMIM